MKNFTFKDHLQPLFDDSKLLQLIEEAKENIEASETISQSDVKRSLDFKELIENE